MKTALLSQKSWHWRLAYSYGSAKITEVWDGEKYVDMYEGNFCKYFWQVVGGAIWALVITVICGLLSWCLVDFFLWIAVGVFYHFIDAPFGAFFFTAMLSIIAFLSAIGGVGHIFFKIREQRRGKVTIQADKPGFFRLAYRKFKDKTCFKIEVR